MGTPRFILIMLKEKASEEVESTESQYSSQCKERVSHSENCPGMERTSLQIRKTSTIRHFQLKASGPELRDLHPCPDLWYERVQDGEAAGLKFYNLWMKTMCQRSIQAWKKRSSILFLMELLNQYVP